MPSRPLLLDLFSGAGGAAAGYQAAGFDVVGVDRVPQPRYPGIQHICADALAPPLDLEAFDVIHASPPCQRFTTMGTVPMDHHPDLIEPTRRLLAGADGLTIIENVMGAPICASVILCGTMFRGLRVLRHRKFEVNFPVGQPECGRHPPVYQVHTQRPDRGLDPHRDFCSVVGSTTPIAAARTAMGIDWMVSGEINEAIPPAYAEYLGHWAMRALWMQPRAVRLRTSEQLPLI